jgi:hypothetical protein
MESQDRRLLYHVVFREISKLPHPETWKQDNHIIRVPNPNYTLHHFVAGSETDIAEDIPIHTLCFTRMYIKSPEGPFWLVSSTDFPRMAYLYS